MSDRFVSIEEYSSLSDGFKCAPEVLEKVTTDDLKTLLYEHTLAPMIQNTIITELKNREPDFEHDDVPEIEGLEEDKKYPVLNFIGSIYHLIGWLLIFGGLTGSICLFSSDSDKSIVDGIIVMVCALFLALMSFAFAEFILVVTDISSSAFKILKKLQDKK